MSNEPNLVVTKYVYFCRLLRSESFLYKIQHNYVSLVVRMASNSQLYKNFVGTVVEIINRYKAVLEMPGIDTMQRALLKVEKLTCKPDINPDGSEDHPISDFVKIGSVLRCWCHKYSETEDHK